MDAFVKMGDVKCLLINHFQESEPVERVPFIAQYVQDVKDFSSQYGSDISISYTAYNITGKPSKYPDYGDFPQAFVMRTYGKWWDEAPSRLQRIMPQNYGDVVSQDYIDIMFEHKLVPFRINVYETYNPGSIVRIWASDGDGTWALLWSGQPRPQHSPQIFSPPLNRINFLTNLLRLEFDHSKLEYYTELDAVLIAGYSSLTADSQTQHFDFPQTSDTPLSQENNSRSSGRRCLSPEEDKSPPGRSQSPPIKSEITRQVLDLELTTWNSKEDIKSSLHHLNDLAKHYTHLLDDINKGIESVTLPQSVSFTNLPDETILNIFRFLDLMSLMSCSRVNRQFNRLASDVMLYTELGLKPYWHQVSSLTLVRLVPKCTFLQKLDLSWCGNYGRITSTQFASFVKDCGKSLTHLRLDCCKFVDDLSIIAISETCLGLRELTLRNCSEITSKGYQRLSGITTLERLDLYRTYIENEPLVSILKSSPDLKHIVLGSCIKISVMDEIAQVLGSYNRQLISADFWKTYSITPVGVKALCNCNQLEEIDLGWCLGLSIPGDCLSLLASSCTKLRKLFMAALRGISDRDLSQFIASCPMLEQIDLLGVRNITDKICFRLLRECKHLKLLDVSFCDQIPDSTIESWIKQFPRVSIKRSFQREQPLTPRIHLHPHPAAL